MKKKCTFVIRILLMMGVGYRIWYINKDVSVPEVITYQMNEEVEIGDNAYCC